MPALIQFVDSISATPTVRLDINDATSWFCASFKAPPPRLRRSVSANAMRDGDHVSSSSYENRTLELELTLVNNSSQDAAATEMQKLWRELDRPTNLLRYQPDGMSKPVFFRLFRSDVSDLEDLWTTPIARNITLELVAEPFALGLKESLGPYTVSNNPAAASNPGYVDLPTILGDVPADVVYWDNASSSFPQRCIATRWSNTPSAVTHFLQAESATLPAGSDTTNPGGGPDAAMSGTGINNFVRVSFATNPAIRQRMRWGSVVQPGGRYRIIAAVRRPAATSVLQLRAQVSGSVAGPLVTIATVGLTGRIAVDLGVHSWPDADPVGYSTVAGISKIDAFGIGLEASRTGGTDTLDIDGIYLIPAGGQYDSVGGSLAIVAMTLYATARCVMDGINEKCFGTDAFSDPTTTALEQYPNSVSGSFPQVAPGVGNRLYVLAWSQTGGTVSVTVTTTVNIAYWPRYLYVRPSTS